MSLQLVFSLFWTETRYRCIGIIEDIEYLSEYRISVSQSYSVFSLIICVRLYNREVDVKETIENQVWPRIHCVSCGEHHSLRNTSDLNSEERRENFIKKTVVSGGVMTYFLMIFWYLDICLAQQGSPLDKTLLLVPSTPLSESEISEEWSYPS